MKTVSVRELREAIGPLLERVHQGEQVLVTRRGRPIARIVPAREETGSDASAHPLRGSLVSMSADFDEPVSDLREATGA